MQLKAYVSGAAVLLAAVLAGCTSGGGVGGSPPDSKGGDTGTTAPVAQPGKYRTLPEACGAADHDTLDTLLPGIQEGTDEAQQEKAYAGEATLTYDTDRRDGCDWKVASAAATDHLFVDFERVVSYDNTVSDESKAEELYAAKQTAADLPEPTASTSASPSASASASGGATPSPGGSNTGPADDNAGGDNVDASGTPGSPSASASQTPADLQSRVLEDLGDEAFLDDKLNTGSSTAQQRTVTVVFRTSNAIVTIEYSEQPTSSASAPDSKEMQDRALKLAQKLTSRLNG